jgi:pimeloyl-ACP methyl ester carboxylesterase
VCLAGQRPHESLAATFVKTLPSWSARAVTISWSCARNDTYLDMPVLFLNAQYDYVCECTHSRLPEPMRKYCRNLTELTIRTGHWMAQEKPREINAALARWIATTVPSVWPRPS